MPKAVDFRRELQARFRQAQDAGAAYVDIVAGNLHRAVGGYPSPEPRIPNCCSVMRQEFDPENDKIISERISNGARFAIRYKLPRSKSLASKWGFWSAERERRQNANGTAVSRLAEQSTIYNITGNAVIGDNANNVTQTATLNIGSTLADIAELKRLLEWAGRERHQDIIQQLSAIQEYLVGGRSTEAKSTWQSIAEKIGPISGTVNNVWELFGRVSQVLT